MSALSARSAQQQAAAAGVTQGVQMNGSSSTDASDPPLPTLFNYSHHQRLPPPTWWQYLALALWTPIAVFFVVPVRLVAFVVVTLVLFLLPTHRTFLPTPLVRAVLLVFGGVVVRVHGERDALHTAHRAARVGGAGARGEMPIVAANHRSAFDVLPFLALHPVRVLIDAHFYGAVAKTFQKVVGAVPLDQSQKHVSDEARERMRAGVVAHLRPPAGAEDGDSSVATTAASGVRFHEAPLLFFPEGWDTNGKRGTLVYQQFLFSLGLPVRPVALDVRVPVLPLEPGMLGVALWSEILWLLAVPCTVWDLHFLPLMHAAPHEAPREFARRVQLATAQHLGIAATSYSNKDALAWRLRIMREPGLRQRAAAEVVREHRVSHAHAE